jgi:hypothetical protein
MHKLRRVYRRISSHSARKRRLNHTSPALERAVMRTIGEHYCRSGMLFSVVLRIYHIELNVGFDISVSEVAARNTRKPTDR